jgi:hypothetical protein
VEANAVPPTSVVEPPPSIGTEVPVDPKAYKLKAYPYYDAPGPAEWEERLLKERGIIPDMPVSEEDAAAQPLDASGADGSTHVDPK